MSDRNQIRGAALDFDRFAQQHADETRDSQVKLRLLQMQLLQKQQQEQRQKQKEQETKEDKDKDEDEGEDEDDREYIEEDDGASPDEAEQEPSETDEQQQQQKQTDGPAYRTPLDAETQSVSIEDMLTYADTIKGKLAKLDVELKQNIRAMKSLSAKWSTIAQQPQPQTTIPAQCTSTPAQQRATSAAPGARTRPKTSNAYVDGAGADEEENVVMEIEIARKHIRAMTENNKRLAEAYKEAQRRVEHGFQIESRVQEHVRFTEARRSEIATLRQKLERLEEAIKESAAVRSAKAQQDELLIRMRRGLHESQQENGLLRQRVADLEKIAGDAALAKSAFLAKNTAKEMNVLERKVQEQEQTLRKVRALLQDKQNQLQDQDTELANRQRRIRLLEMELVRLGEEKEKLLTVMMGAQDRADTVEKSFEKRTKHLDILLKKRQMELGERERALQDFSGKLIKAISLCALSTTELIRSIEDARDPGNVLADGIVAGLDARELSTVNTVIGRKLQTSNQAVRTLVERIATHLDQMKAAVVSTASDPTYISLQQQQQQQQSAQPAAKSSQELSRPSTSMSRSTSRPSTSPAPPHSQVLPEL